jgi:hypothetical protein
VCAPLRAEAVGQGLTTGVGLREMIPESGVHIDVPKQQVGAWVTTEARGLFDLLQDRWPGWQTDFREDRYEEQVSRCEGALRVPEGIAVQVR